MIFLLQLAFIFLEDYAFLKKKVWKHSTFLVTFQVFFHKCLPFSRPPSIGLYNTRSHRHPKHPNWRQKYGEKLYFGTRDCTGYICKRYLFICSFIYFFHFIRITYVYITQESLDAESLDWILEAGWKQFRSGALIRLVCGEAAGHVRSYYQTARREKPYPTGFNRETRRFCHYFSSLSMHG